VTDFADKGSSLLEKIEQLLKSRDELILGKNIHKLMSMASSVGALKISDNAFRFKLALRKENFENCEQLFTKLSHEFKHFIKQTEKFIHDN